MSDTKRLFISLPLSLELRADLVSYQEEWTQLPVRWVSEYELHITLLFLGETPVEMIPSIIEGMEEIATEFDLPEVDISGIELGPPGNRKSLIWAIGEGVSDIHFALANELGDRGVYRQQKKRFITHITLGRLLRGALPKQEFYVVNIPLKHSFKTNRMELKESKLLSDGAHHSVLETIKF